MKEWNAETNGTGGVQISAKTYNRAYFDRWYRHPRLSITRDGLLERRVGMAVGVAEFLLERPIRTVLDVGCGEGAWRELLRRRRPGCSYLGVDPSDYVARRFGKRRNIRRGTLSRLDELGLRQSFDLIVCADVLHFIPAREARRGLRALTRRLGGVAYMETYTADDATEGDDDGFLWRRAGEYRRLFRSVGLSQIGPHCYVRRQFANGLAALEAIARKDS